MATVVFILGALSSRAASVGAQQTKLHRFMTVYTSLLVLGGGYAMMLARPFWIAITIMWAIVIFIGAFLLYRRNRNGA